jgi:hypothetical protein
MALWIIGSVLYRRSEHKPIFRPRFDNPLFLETWRSGRSLRNILTRLGGARNCLWVAVADGQLRIAPHFPFSLMFLPEIYRAEVAVSGSAIRRIETLHGLFGERVRVTVERASGGEEVIEIRLHDTKRFEAAVGAIRSAT